MDITIFTTNTCAYCDAVKQYLDSKEKSYTVINIDEQPEKKDDMMQYTSMMTVPVVVVKQADQEPKVIQGWNPAKLAEAVA